MGLIHETAEVDPGASVDPSAFVWGLAQVRAGAFVGEGCIVSRGAYIGSGVHVAARVKIQNYALVYEWATVGEGAFIGPGAILTNDHNPRAVRIDGQLKSGEDWQPVGVTVGRGASIGAGAICVAPLVVGEWALIGAGSVVTTDVPDFALVVGSPARQVGWVGRAGHRLEPGPESSTWICTQTGESYLEEAGRLRLQGGGS